MALIHVSGAKLNCPTCHGTGVKPLFGFGTPCHCTEGFDDPYQQAVEQAREDMKAAFEKVFGK
jgi:hypothetical protein